MSKKILILSTEFGTEADENAKPAARLAELGHYVTIATPGGKDVQTMKQDKELGPVVKADADVATVSGDADVIVLPGGTINADTARMDADIQRLVKAQVEAGRSIAAICHAPWILVESGVAKGKKMTSVENIRTDLANAGAHVVDEELATCGANGWTLLTSRTPKDIDAFIKAIDEA